MTDDILGRFKLNCHATSYRSDRSGPISLGPTQCSHQSGPVGPSFQFHQLVLVRSESKGQSVRFGRSKLVDLGPTGLDQDRTETEVVHPWAAAFPKPGNLRSCVLQSSRT